MAKSDFWQKLRQNILRRKEPFTTFHFSFFKSSPTKCSRIHRHVWLNTHKKFQPVLRLLAYSYNLIRWYLFYAWSLIFKTYNYFGKKYSEEHGISKFKQITDLFALAFAYTIKPQEYYNYKLFKVPRARWLDFAYDFQAKSWHEALDYNDNDKSKKLIADKAKFEKFLKQHQISTIDSLIILKKNKTISAEQLDKLPARIFLKPAVGNRSQGCFILQKDTELKHDHNLSLIHFPSLNLSPFLKLDDINDIIKYKKYLIQPLIENHHDFATLFATKVLSTIRIISFNYAGRCEVVSAILENPLPHNPKFCWNLDIDIASGTFNPPKNEKLLENQDFKKWFAKLKNASCPHWQEIKSICIKAHKKIPNILTIGWDLAVGPEGPLIIEGNITWTLSQSQILTGTPICKTRLGQIYTDFIENKNGKS